MADPHETYFFLTVPKLEPEARRSFEAALAALGDIPGLLLREAVLPPEDQEREFALSRPYTADFFIENGIHKRSAPALAKNLGSYGLCNRRDVLVMGNDYLGRVSGLGRQGIAVITSDLTGLEQTLLEHPTPFDNAQICHSLQQVTYLALGLSPEEVKALSHYFPQNFLPKSALLSVAEVRQLRTETVSSLPPLLSRLQQRVFDKAEAYAEQFAAGRLQQQPEQ